MHVFRCPMTSISGTPPSLFLFPLLAHPPSELFFVVVVPVVVAAVSPYRPFDLADLPTATHLALFA